MTVNVYANIKYLCATIVKVNETIVEGCQTVSKDSETVFLGTRGYGSFLSVTSDMLISHS